MSADQDFEFCKVETYSGQRADERPRSMVVEGRSITLIAVRTMRIEEDRKSRRRKRYFTVQGDDGREYELLHDVAADRWLVRRA